MKLRQAKKHFTKQADVCYKFQSRMCSANQCSRAHKCSGCGREGVPHDDCGCAEAQFWSDFASLKTASGGQVEVSPARCRPSTQVTPPGFVFNILLVAGDAVHEAEIVEASQTAGKESGDALDHTLFHYNHERAHDVLAALDILDRIRLGFFHVVFIVPPAASWVESKARRRRRSVSTENTVTTVRGGAREQVTGLRTLVHGTNFAVRGYTYSSCIGISGGLRRKCCLGSVVVVVLARAARSRARQLAGGDAKRPLGIFSNLPDLQQVLRVGWPTLHSHKTRRYSCTRDHFPKLVLARQLISQWWACPPSTISTRPPTFSWVQLSGAAFLRQSGRVQNLSPSRPGNYAGLTLHSQVGSPFFCLFLLVFPTPELNA